jgi:hypothetical protein
MTQGEKPVDILEVGGPRFLGTNKICLFYSKDSDLQVLLRFIPIISACVEDSSANGRVPQEKRKKGSRTRPLIGPHLFRSVRVCP